MQNFKCLSCMCYHFNHLVVKERNSRIHSTLYVASKFDRFESSWLQSVRNTARDGVQNTHHWSGPTAIEYRVGWAGLCCHCGSHLSVASSIAPVHWCVLYTFSRNIPNTLCPTGFKSGESEGHSWGGINFGVILSDNSVVARRRWAFQVSQGSVETLFRWGGKC